MKKINIAQIGIGYWGPNLLRNLVANNNCDVKTVVDLSDERREFARELYPFLKVSEKVEDIISYTNTYTYSSTPKLVR